MNHNHWGITFTPLPVVVEVVLGGVTVALALLVVVVAVTIAVAELL